MVDVSIQDLMAAGTHFGHQSKRWNPKMKKYIFGAKNGVNIIDLNQTIKLFREAIKFARKLGENGQTILFVGTKPQAKKIINEEAQRCGMPYMCERWLGGTMTNFDTVKKSVGRLAELSTMAEDGTFDALMKKEGIKLQKERAKLEKNLGGIKDMERLPDAVFIVDTIKEKIALLEALKLGIPVIAMVDTNCDPKGIDYIIPSNDDAIKGIRLITKTLVDSFLKGCEDHKLKKQAQEEEEAMAAKAKAEEKEAKVDSNGEASGKSEEVIPEDAKDGDKK